MSGSAVGLESNALAIVGGGPSGLVTALSLAAHAPELTKRVVVLEKATYPREKYCAGAIGGRGLRILEALNAWPDVPAVRIDGMRTGFAGGQRHTRLGREIGRVVRRFEFDAGLAEIARRRGIRIEEGVTVEDLEQLPDGGVRLDTSRGAITAAAVVGADGVTGRVRKRMGLGAGSLRAQVLEVDTEPVEGDPDRRMLDFDLSDWSYAGYIWGFPTLVDGEPLVCRGIYHLRVDGGRVDIRAKLSEHLAARGLDLTKYRNKRFAERGLSQDETFAHGSCLLVGEAAGIDAITGEGIAQGIEYGALAGPFLARALEGRAVIEQWNNVVRRSRLRSYLGLRRRIGLAYYGRQRAAFERFVLRNPSALRLGCQHFAKLPFEKLRLTWLLIRGAMAVGRMKLVGLRRHTKLLQPGTFADASTRRSTNEEVGS